VSLFRNLTLRGSAGSISWGYRTAAHLGGWTLYRNEKREWTLVATFDRADRFALGRSPLRFNAPRPGGYFTFPVLAVQVGAAQLTARLGQPEH
jgi:hypothetical protein